MPLPPEIMMSASATSNLSLAFAMASLTATATSALWFTVLTSAEPPSTAVSNALARTVIAHGVSTVEVSIALPE